jgi:hypothetical protein
VIGMTLGGSKPKEIRDVLDISRGAIRSTLSLEQLREHGKAQLRSGRLLEYIIVEEQKLVWHIRLYLKDSYTDVKIAYRLTIRKTTIKKILS